MRSLTLTGRYVRHRTTTTPERYPLPHTFAQSELCLTDHLPARASTMCRRGADPLGCVLGRRCGRTARGTMMQARTAAGVGLAAGGASNMVSQSRPQRLSHVVSADDQVDSRFESGRRRARTVLAILRGHVDGDGSDRKLPECPPPSSTLSSAHVDGAQRCPRFPESPS